MWRRVFHVQCTRNSTCMCIAESRGTRGKRPIKCNWGGWVSTVAVILEAEIYSISFWLE